MWYGLIYFFFIFVIIGFFVIFFLRLNYFYFLDKFNFFYFFLKLILSFVLFFLLLSLNSLYAFFYYFENFKIIYVNNLIWDFNLINVNLIDINLTSNLLLIYYFPFIYIFLIVTVLSIFYCLSYNYNEINAFITYCSIILMAGYTLFFTDSLIIFFFAYEALLVPSFFILYKFAKTRRCVEAAYLMFFWTQFGALMLIFSFLYLILICKSSSFWSINEFTFSNFEINFFFICWFLGFGVKFPIWPFYNWLPKAHVEASTNFSIFLSGVLVKFAFFGFLKCLLTIQLEPTFYFIFPFLLIGITDSVFKLFYQIDLKKLVAYSTVVEMHWLTICVISGQTCLMLTSFCMLISHALLSTNSFLLVDAINRRFKTRLITEISGINFYCPKLFLASLINCLIFLGFPGSIFFIAEILFFSFLMDLYPIVCLFLIILLYLLGPTFFFRTWVNVLFGLSLNSKTLIPLDLNSRELIIFFGLIILMFWLGFSWQFFIF